MKNHIRPALGYYISTNARRGQSPAEHCAWGYQDQPNHSLERGKEQGSSRQPDEQNDRMHPDTNPNLRFYTMDTREQQSKEILLFSQEPSHRRHRAQQHVPRFLLRRQIDQIEAVMRKSRRLKLWKVAV